MHTRHSTRALGMLGLCLLVAPLLRPAWPRFRSSLPVPALPQAPPPGSPAAAARHTALHYWMLVQLSVNQQREALEAWDPAADADLDQETLRLQLTAADRTGDLHRALKAGKLAAALARTPRDKYEAAVLLSGLEAVAGHPAAALAQARRVMALQPHSLDSRLVLWHAEACGGRGPFARSPRAWHRRHL